MNTLKIFFVHLRRPRDSNDLRTDPLYEFGSFGCTKCHCKNLFHPRNDKNLADSRLAFVQGGKGGSRLVFLTPPISVKVWANNCEANWRPGLKPFKYSEAPVLVANKEKSIKSDFPLVEDFARTANRTTLEGGLASLIRSSSSPLPPDMAKEVVRVYEKYRKKYGDSAIAKDYWDALPYIKKKDKHRKRTYNRLKRKLCAEKNREARTQTSHVTSLPNQALSQCRSTLQARRRRAKQCT